MYRLLLVPLDGSVFAEHALATAGMIAKRTGAAILLTRVHLPLFGGELPETHYWETDVRKDETEYLLRTAARVEEEFGVRVETGLLNDPVVPAICDRAREDQASLIVMCTHGLTGFSRAWLGSTADGVVRHTSVPVLMLRPRDAVATARVDDPERLFEHTIIPLDGSPLAEEALEPAAALASALDSAVTLLRIVEPTVARAVDYPLPYPLPLSVVDRDSTDAALGQAERYLDAMVGRLRAGNRKLIVSHQVRLGDAVAQTILEVAAQTRAGLVAMATHGRGMSRLIVGSVADKVLRGSDGAVLLLRPSHD